VVNYFWIKLELTATATKQRVNKTWLCNPRDQSVTWTFQRRWTSAEADAST